MVVAVAWLGAVGHSEGEENDDKLHGYLGLTRRAEGIRQLLGMRCRPSQQRGGGGRGLWRFCINVGNVASNSNPFLPPSLPPSLFNP